MNHPIVPALTRILADTYALAIKTHSAHWNVRGPGFFQLHDAFEAQYDAMFEAADTLAERIRALGATAPSGIHTLAQLSSLPQAKPETDGPALVAELLDDHRAIVERLKAGVKTAEDGDDDATADFLIERIQEHEKAAWMLAAYIG